MYSKFWLVNSMPVFNCIFKASCRSCWLYYLAYGFFVVMSCDLRSVTAVGQAELISGYQITVPNTLLLGDVGVGG